MQLQFTSRFPELLAPEVIKVRRYFETIEGLIDVEDTLPMPGIEWELDVDRAQAGRFGADIVGGYWYGVKDSDLAYAQGLRPHPNFTLAESLDMWSGQTKVFEIAKFTTPLLIFIKPFFCNI